METNNEQAIRLTQYSHGAGCGCKLSPAVLDTILKGDASPEFKNLLVGNSSRDDAAVYDLGDGSAVISTTDFFMPIVDDAFDFGAIASANAISDVYAMGGKPLMAIAILGWPIDKLSPEVANEVLQGARSICEQANIPLAGGHSIDSPEPIFGLAVTGRVLLEHLKQNNTAKEGDVLYLTKPLGVGILSTLEKRSALKDGDKGIAANFMKRLNKFGAVLGEQSYVNSLTDVTGFGLLGHLIEMADGSGLTAKINYNEVPKIPAVLAYLDAKNVPGGTNRNWASYGEKVQLEDETWRYLLADPQTSGGLLVAVKKESCQDFEKLAATHDMVLSAFGSFEKRQVKSVYVH